MRVTGKGRMRQGKKRVIAQMLLIVVYVRAIRQPDLGIIQREAESRCYRRFYAISSLVNHGAHHILVGRGFDVV